MNYKKLKNLYRLVFYGRNDINRNNDGSATSSSLIQTNQTRILTPYITNYISNSYNSKIMRFSLNNCFNNVSLAENSYLYLNTYTLPIINNGDRQYFTNLKLLGAGTDKDYNNLSFDNPIIATNFHTGTIAYNPELTPSISSNLSIVSEELLDLDEGIYDVYYTNRILTTTIVEKGLTTIKTEYQLLECVNPPDADYFIIDDVDLNVNTSGNVLNSTKIYGYNDFYYQLTTNDLKVNILPQNSLKCDVLLVGAGGNGGSNYTINNITYYGGGGGAGELIYIKDLDVSETDLISIIKNTNETTMTHFKDGSIMTYTAQKGGNGGDYSNLPTLNGGAVGDLTEQTGVITNNTSITSGNSISLLFNYTDTSTINAGTYNIQFTNGSITIDSIVNKSYPILKDINGNTINPVVWYKFDNNTNLGLDSINGNFNLTNNSSSSYDSSIFTKGSGSVAFNGTSQFLSTTNFYDLNDKSFSISFWCYSTKSTLTSSYGAVCSISAISGANINTNGTNFLQIAQFPNNQWIAGNHCVSNTSSTNQKDTWIFITYTFNSVGTNKQEYLYRNGIQIASSTTKTSNYSFTNLTFNLGGRTLTGSPLYWQGNIDDFRVYNQVLTPTDVGELYRGRVSYYTSSVSPGENGGSTTSNINITGSNVIYGLGGTGASAGSTPASKVGLYGYGGDGNGGVGGDGTIIVRFKDLGSVNTTNITTQYIEQPYSITYTNDFINYDKTKLNSVKLPKNFLNKNYVDFEINTLLSGGSNLTFDKEQLDRLIIDASIIELE